MIVGSIRLTIRLHGCSSLKEKRSPRQRISQKIRNRFKVAVAEVDTQDVWTLITLGVATVGSNRALVERVLRDVADFVEEDGEGELIEEVVEIERY